MSVTKFLVQVEISDRTKFVFSEEAFIAMLRQASEDCAALVTKGPAPAVSVTREEFPQEVES